MTVKPTPPRHVVALPASRGAGVNDDQVEMRSRLVFGLIDRGITNVDALLTLTDRMELGPDFDDEEASDE